MTTPGASEAVENITNWITKGGGVQISDIRLVLDELTRLRSQAREIERVRAEARNDALEEAALLVETTVISGPEDDEIDHDDYRDTQMAFAIRALKRQTP